MNKQEVEAIEKILEALSCRDNPAFGIKEEKRMTAPNLKAEREKEIETLESKLKALEEYDL